MADTQPPKSLTNLAGKFQMSLDTVDAEVSRLISRFGVAAVRDSVKRLGKRKAGRKPEQDWPEIAEFLREDARLWLDGGDPFIKRSNYAIAKAVIKRKPGHDPVSSHTRIMRKLSDRRQRITLITAWEIAKAEYPFADCIRALDALCATTDRAMWQRLRELAQGYLDRYSEKFGPPDSAMTMDEIEAAGRNALLSLPESPLPRLNGLLGRYIR